MVIINNTTRESTSIHMMYDVVIYVPNVRVRFANVFKYSALSGVTYLSTHSCYVTVYVYHGQRPARWIPGSHTSDCCLSSSLSCTASS